MLFWSNGLQATARGIYRQPRGGKSANDGSKTMPYRTGEKCLSASTE